MVPTKERITGIERERGAHVWGGGVTMRWERREGRWERGDFPASGHLIIQKMINRKIPIRWKSSFLKPHSQTFSNRNISWFTEDQAFFLAFLWFGSSPTPFFPPPVSKLSLWLGLPVCRRSGLLTEEGGRGWARSQIIRSRKSLALYKSFNTVLFQPSVPLYA